MISQLRILDEVQEEFNLDDELNVQIIWANYKPLTNYEDNVVSMSERYFVEAGAANIPFFMFDEAYSMRVVNMDVHILFAEHWEIADQASGTPDSALISPDGEVIERFVMFDGANWYGYKVKDFILSHI